MPHGLDVGPQCPGGAAAVKPPPGMTFGQLGPVVGRAGLVTSALFAAGLRSWSPAVVAAGPGTSAWLGAGLPQAAADLEVGMSHPVIARSQTRNMALDQLAAMLRDQSARQLDVIAGAGAIRLVGGRLLLEGTEPELGPDGVTMTAGRYAVNEVANAGLADKLGIPAAYLRRLHADHPDLYDQNVNGWLDRTDRRFLVRVLRGEAGGGVVRAFLSDRYSRIDNLDVLMAVLDGVRRSGAQVQVDGCDLTERRMHVRLYAPQVRALAPQLLGSYRSPFDGRPGADLPVVWAGFVISNSETGCGAFTIAPRLVVEVCRNGMVIDHAGLRRTHLGARHSDDGVVAWSQETTSKTLDLIASRTRDAVAAYLDADFVTRTVRALEAVAATPVSDPDITIKQLGQRLRYTEEQQRGLLAHFIAGADLSAGGILHAVTSLAQTLPDADAAYELEATAVHAMRIAAGR